MAVKKIVQVNLKAERMVKLQKITGIHLWTINTKISARDTHGIRVLPIPLLNNHQILVHSLVVSPRVKEDHIRAININHPKKVVVDHVMVTSLINTPTALVDRVKVINQVNNLST